MLTDPSGRSFKHRTHALVIFVVLALFPLAGFYGYGIDLLSESKRSGLSPMELLATDDDKDGFRPIFSYLLALQVTVSPVASWAWINRVSNTSIPTGIWCAGVLAAVLLLPIGVLPGLLMCAGLFYLNRRT